MTPPAVGVLSQDCRHCSQMNRHPMDFANLVSLKLAQLSLRSPTRRVDKDCPPPRQHDTISKPLTCWSDDAATAARPLGCRRGERARPIEGVEALTPRFSVRAA